jgi:type I restriction enzyme S subunit
MTEWKEFVLEDITSRIGDGLHGTPKYDANGVYFFINGNNLKDGKILIKPDTKKVSKEEAIKHERPLSDRTLLLSINGTIGNLAFYNYEKCMLGKSACYININEDVSVPFMYYHFLSEEFQFYIEMIATGTTIPNVPLKGIRQYTFNLPSKPEQCSIASVLSSIDAKIDLLHRQNQTLEQMAETLFRQWFVEEADDEWEMGTLNDVLTVKGGTTPSTKKPEFWDGDIHWTSPRDITTLNSIYLFDTERKITNAGLKKISSGLLPKGTLLMSSRAPVGVLAFAEVPIAINQGYIAILDEKGFSKEFLFLWLKTNMDYVQSYANGSTFLEISKSAFKSLKIQIPPDKLRNEFQEWIMPIFRKMKSNQIQIRTLTALRDTLLPKLMSGEVRVEIA